MAKTYENLEAWKEAIDLAIRIYEATETFPREEIYGITSQIRKATVSISSNIAEGSGRKSRKDFRQFIHIASGSLNEVESLLIICLRLNLIAGESFGKLKEKVERLGRLIGGLLRFLSEKE